MTPSVRSLLHKRELYLVLGFGLFKGTETAAYSNGILFYSAGKNAPDAFYSIFPAVAAIAVGLLVSLLAARNRLLPWKLPYTLPTALLVVAYIGSYPGLLTHASTLVTLGVLGVMGGLGFGMLFIAWAELFSAEEPRSATVHIALAFLIWLASSSAVRALPTRVAVPCAIVLLLASAFCLHQGRRSIRPIETSAASMSVKPAFVDLSDALASLLVCQIVIGMLGVILDSGTLPSARYIAWVPYVIFCLVAALSLRSVNPTTVYKALFPPVVAALLLIPFVGETSAPILLTVVRVYRDFLMIAMLLVLVETVHRLRISAYILFGLAWGAVRLSLLAGMVLGVISSGFRNESEFARLTLIAFVAVYLLSMVLLFYSRRNRKTANETAVVRSHEEEIAGRVARIAEQYGLTARESEILGYFARGRSSEYISKELVVSHNTVRSHIRSTYAKLGVHKKQHLLDLIEKTVPKDL